MLPLASQRPTESSKSKQVKRKLDDAPNTDRTGSVNSSVSNNAGALGVETHRNKRIRSAHQPRYSVLETKSSGAPSVQCSRGKSCTARSASVQSEVVEDPVVEDPVVVVVVELKAQLEALKAAHATEIAAKDAVIASEVAKKKSSRQAMSQVTKYNLDYSDEVFSLRSDIAVLQSENEELGQEIDLLNGDILQTVEKCDAALSAQQTSHQVSLASAIRPVIHSSEQHREVVEAAHRKSGEAERRADEAEKKVDEAKRGMVLLMDKLVSALAESRDKTAIIDTIAHELKEAKFELKASVSNIEYVMQQYMMQEIAIESQEKVIEDNRREIEQYKCDVEYLLTEVEEQPSSTAAYVIKNENETETVTETVTDAVTDTNAAPEIDVVIGGSFRAYVVGPEIASGASASVHECTNDPNVLVKRFSQQGADQAGGINEVAIMNRVGGSSFVVALVSSWTSPKPAGLYHIAMEKFALGDLASFFQLGADVPSSFITDCIKALLHIHDCNVLHRDIKADNILVRFDDVTGEQSLAIADFGISAFVDQLVDGGRRWTSCGSPGYCAPEVLVSEPPGSGYGCAADVYSLGIVLFELVAGCRVAEQCCVLNGSNGFKFDSGSLDEVIYDSALSCFAPAATECVSSYEDERPTLGNLLEMVEELLQ